MSPDLVTTLLQFQPDSPQLKQRRDYDHAARSFVAQLSNISSGQWAKAAETQDVFTTLDPAVHSIAYAFALRHRITSMASKSSAPDTLTPGGELWNKLVHFFESFDPVQMRYAGHEWRRLVDLAEQIARATGSPSLAIAPIRSAMIRLDPTTGSFTSTHLAFIRLCMETRSYAAAEPILDNYIHSIAPKIPNMVREGLEYSVPCADVVSSGEYINQVSGHSDRIGLLDVQEYYVLGAMAYIGLRQFKKAQQFLEHVLVVPSSGNTGNGLMLEAYRKWVLLNCLVDEVDKSVPRTANTNAIKQIKLASKAYEALAEAYAQSSEFPKLRAQIKAGSEIWTEDGNTGLVQEVSESQMRTYVSRLSRTFSAIPVSNIANNVGGSAEEAARYLETLIADGYLNACLEQSDKSNIGMVLRFYLDPTQGPLAKTENQQQQALFEQTLRTNMLAEQVKDADYRLSLTKDHIDHVKRQNKRPAQGGESMEAGWEDGIDAAEEDLMLDLQ